MFISELLKERGDSNVFHEFYSALVQALFDTGVTKNVFCVNIDAIIATILLKLLWPRYKSGDFSEEAMESSAFTAFLFGRMAGCAGEIDDHINRGRNMDTRTPTSHAPRPRAHVCPPPRTHPHTHMGHGVVHALCPLRAPMPLRCRFSGQGNHWSSMAVVH